MELFRNLFEGYPNLWGGGVAHSVLILSLVIAFGIMLGKIKVAGISLGVTWILFVGIVFGHFNLILYRPVASPAARHVCLLSAFSRDVFLLL